jgi:hypothetical protein
MSPMDPMTFATLVGLLSEFVSHRRAGGQATLEEFKAWLSERRHEEIVSILSTTSTAAIGTKALLSETRDVLLTRLTAIDQALIGYASAVEGFSQLAQAASPGFELSEQAVSILKQIDASGASKVLEMHHGFDGGTSLLFMDGKQNGEVNITDPRFLEDDLARLEQLALLRPDFNSKGGRFFHFTRAAASLLRKNGA